jgi:hypothetical protein
VRHLANRASEVALEERRRLVLLVRATPLTLTHLPNIAAVTETGGIIAPPVPTFYIRTVRSSRSLTARSDEYCISLTLTPAQSGDVETFPLSRPEVSHTRLHGPQDGWSDTPLIRTATRSGNPHGPRDYAEAGTWRPARSLEIGPKGVGMRLATLPSRQRSDHD